MPSYIGMRGSRGTRSPLVMQPLVSVLALSDSFSELWPKLIVSFKAGMRWGAAIAELETLAQSCCVVVSAAGAEVEAVRAVEQLLARQAPAIMVVGVETDYRLVAALLSRLFA